MQNLKNILYILSCIAFTVIIGAAIYEHLSVWPKALSGPPASLTIFQGEFGHDGGVFWRNIHPVTLFLMILSLIFFWRSERRLNLLITFGGYLVIIAVTAIYFVPELVEIIKTPYAEAVDAGLVARGQLWEQLSIVRLFVLIGLACFLLLGLTKAPNSAVNS